jgi:hypothetical protein
VKPGNATTVTPLTLRQHSTFNSASLPERSGTPIIAGTGYFNWTFQFSLSDREECNREFTGQLREIYEFQFSLSDREECSVEATEGMMPHKNFQFSLSAEECSYNRDGPFFIQR